MGDKYAIIGKEIHKLVRIKPRSEWSKYAWRIHEKDDYYWVPLKDEKKQPPAMEYVCPECKRKHPWWKEKFPDWFGKI